MYAKCQQHIVVAVRHIAKLIPEEVWVGHTSVYPLVETPYQLKVSDRTLSGVKQLGLVESLIKEFHVLQQLVRTSHVELADQ